MAGPAGGEGRVEADRVGAGPLVGQFDGFAQREVAEAEVAVRFVGERVDDEVEIARFLEFVRADVDPAVHDAGKWFAALVVQRHAAHAGFRVEFARVDRRAAGQEGVRQQLAAVGQCRAAVVGQWAQQWIGDSSSIAGRVEFRDCVSGADEIVTKRHERVDVARDEVDVATGVARNDRGADFSVRALE